jgi:hypothetical protein
MADTIFLRLDAKFALGADDLQWILYRSRREEPSPLGAPLKFGRGSEWLPVSFVRSRKDILLRCMREKGCKPCDEAKVALAMLSCTFDAWKAAVTVPEAQRSGTGAGYSARRGLQGQPLRLHAGI